MASPLLAARKAKNISLSQLGDAVELTKGQLSRIERCESRPSAKTVQRLFEFFEGAVTREQLMFPEEYCEKGGKKPVRSERPQVEA